MRAGPASLGRAGDALSRQVVGNKNPPEIGLVALLREDLRANGGTVFEQGFWAVAVHRLSNWRMSLRRGPIRAPFTFLYRVL